MPPKKASTGATKKSAAAAPSHGSYQDMIREAIINLKDRSGSSRQAIKKYIKANNKIDATEAVFTSQLNRALAKGSDSGVFTRPKGPSGPVKLAGPKTGESKPAAKTAAKKAPAAKKTAAAKKTTTAKKATTAKTATKKAPAAKKPAAKAKANTGKARKVPAAAPAVVDKAPVVTGKTKSGRVTKTKAPQAEKKATATKRKAPAKKATPKKAATKA